MLRKGSRILVRFFFSPLSATDIEEAEKQSSHDNEIKF